MNYKSLAKGALALSFSLIVGTAAATTSDVQKYGATFESAENGVTNDFAYVVDAAIGTYTKTEGGATYGWLASEGDESKIISANGGQALQLNTDAGTLTNKLASGVATEVNAGIAATGAYIETEAKFVASDTLDAGVVGGTDDTKFAIYAYADDNKSPCTTNLVVYHAYYDGATLKYTNEVFNTLIDCDVYTKLRIEMRQTETLGGDTVNVFSVKVGNDTPLTSDLAYEDDIWFLTVEHLSNEDQLLSSITFKGTGEVDNLAVGIMEEAAPPAPTIITVAQTIGTHGGSISNGNFQAAAGVATPITITADQGYVVAQIVTNGFPVADALGQTSVTFDAVFSDAEGANNSIVATFAKDNAWFINPFIRFKASYDASANTFLASLSPDETSFFVGKSPSAGGGAVMFNVPTLLNNLDPAYSPLRNVAASEITDGAALRGGAASSELQLAIAGTLTVGSNWVIPFDNSVAPYKVTHSIGVALDALDFGANSTCLYAGAYTSGYRTKVWKLSFANNLASGDTLTVEATYDVASAGIARVRAICAETIGGKEYVFVAGGDDSFQGVAVIDTTTGTVTRVLDMSISGQYIQPMSIDIAGIADGTPRMYIGFLGSESATGSMRVYALAADGLSAISTEPVATIPGSVLKVGDREAFAVNVFTLDGETNAVACSAAGVWNSGRVTEAYVLEKKPANLIVRGTFDKGVTVDDRSVAFGDAASETFTAPTGATITNVTVNGVAQQVTEGATSFTYTAAELNEYVYIDLLATEPAVPEPTIITVAQTIGAHGSSVSNGNFQAAAGVATPITITADQGYVVAQIVTNGFAVADALGETEVSFTAIFSDAEGANNSIIATFAKADAWFVDPFVRNTFNSGVEAQNTQTVALDELNDVVGFGTAPGASGAGIAQWTLTKLTNEFGKVTSPEYSKIANNAHDAEYWGRSIAAVPTFNAFISCNYETSSVVVSPYGGPWVEEGDVSYTVSMNMGASGLAAPHLYPITVNKAGTFLYGTDSDGSKIYKFEIVADAQDNTKIGSLQYAASWDFTGGGSLKAIGVGTFNGHDVVYMSKNASRGLWTLDVTSGTLTKTGVTVVGDVYALSTSGVADGTPRLLVAGQQEPTAGGLGQIAVYDLTADGALLTATPVFSDVPTAFATSINRAAAVALDDDSRLLLGTYLSGNWLSVTVVEKKPANLIVRGVINQGAADDRSVTFGAAASETFTVPEGGTITAVTVNGVNQQIAEGATSFTYDANELTEYVYVNIAADLPEPQGYNYPEGTAISDSAQLAWIADKGFTQAQITALGSNAKFNECYLLNCDISQNGAGGSITITGITVDAQGVHVTVALTRTAGIAGGINGTLKLQGTADLATAPATLTTDVSVVNEKFTTDGPATATFTGTGATFFKAIVE